MTNCYCYYESIDPNALAVVNLWKAGWEKHGWNPIVLGEYNFKEWLRWDEYDLAVTKLPTVNNPRYERACFRRWGAMTLRGGIMLDYDVMNYGFRPEHVPSTDRCLLLDGDSPCVVTATPEEYERACNIFMAYQPAADDLEGGHPHTSDMHISTKLIGMGVFERVRICREYKNDGWQEAPLVHYSAFKCGSNKVKIINAERPI